MLTEKQIEDVFEQYYEYLIEKGLAFKARQYKLENNLRIDLLFQDKNEKGYDTRNWYRSRRCGPPGCRHQ